MAAKAQVLSPTFDLDLQEEQLRKGTRTIHLCPKTFAVLRYLAERPERLVTKEELFEACG
jgi:DNA-binding winged helix-turn-helix (wHTH) protein